MEELLKKLVSYKSTTGNFEEVDKLLRFIQSYFSDTIYKTDYQTKLLKYNNYSSLLISNSDDLNFDVFFCGHIDVVSAMNEQFELKRNRTFYYGRGVFDMKGQVAAILESLKNTKTAKKVGFLITSDEEIGGFNGTNQFLKEHPSFNSKIVIIPDGGNNFDLIYSEKGVLQLDIKVKGKRAHSADLHKGVNAIRKSFKIFKKISKISLVNDPFKSKLEKTTINLASLNSGDNIFNQVPDIAEMKIDIRYNQYFNKNKVFEYLNMLKNKDEIEYKIYAEGINFLSNPEHEVIKKYTKIVKKVINREVRIKHCNSASDARFFSNLNIPTVIMNPLGYDMHGDNERINITSLNMLREIYNLLLLEENL